MLWINKEKTFKVLIIFNKSQSQQCTNRNRFHWNWKNSTISLEFSLTFPINQSSECSLAPNPNPISLSDSGKTFSLQFSFLSLRSTFPFHRFSYLYILNSLTLKPCLFPENLTFFFFSQKETIAFFLNWRARYWAGTSTLFASTISLLSQQPNTSLGFLLIL